MSTFQWQESYSLNIPQIDRQHQKLVALIGDMYEAMKMGKGQEAAGLVLLELINYTRTHFATEEKLMKAHAYSGYDRHKQEHEALTGKVL
jgi:hemerythrin